ncbi:MAG: exodeoxyribonuclease V subunit alpha [Idiomarina sp.]|nr:exodeoxyribonuclease V subunit alpha [Idiomarina sp.]
MSGLSLSLRQVLSQVLSQWQEQGWMRALDRTVATMLLRQGCNEQVALMAALASHQVGRGHTCLALSQFAQLDSVASTEHNLFELPPSGWQPDATTTDIMHLQPLLQQVFGIQSMAELPSRWQQIANDSDAVTVLPASDSQNKATDVSLAPLVYDPQLQLLYLRRYWQHEARIGSWLQSRFHQPAEPSLPLLLTQESQVPAPELLREIVRAITKPSTTDSTPSLEDLNWQGIACVNAAKFNFSVITGGPGTGKTFTVIRVLSTLLALAEHNGQQGLRIALAAPTGKAAARMQQSINNELKEHPESFTALRNCLPGKASTLHRLLGSQRGTRYFRHHRDFPLPHDVVVVDEASMIDTEMFDNLLDALAPSTRLILLGDKDQLAPVETGSILASLCRGAEDGGYARQHWEWLQQATGETLPESLIGADAMQKPHLNHVVMLRKSHRFTGLIADLAKAVNTCDLAATAQALTIAEAKEAREAREAQKAAPVSVLRIKSPMQTSAAYPNNRLITHLAQGFQPFVQACSASTRDAAQNTDAWAIDVLKAYSQYQCLTALREGPYGQVELNRQLSLRLQGKAEQWYHGRPVMVTSNDYSLNLNNGDIGVALFHPESRLLKVAFPGSEPNSVRWVLPSRLSQVETVYAMTVHKSQGSEFPHAVLVLPDRGSPVLTKELVYTGITRAKQQLTLVIPNQAVWETAITQRIERLGGLFSER